MLRDFNNKTAPTPSGLDPFDYYWGGRTDANLETGEWKEIWHSSFRNPSKDHDIVITFGADGKIICKERRDGF
jgi:hypothetical protein